MIFIKFKFAKISKDIYRTTDEYFFASKDSIFGIMPYIKTEYDSHERTHNYYVGMTIKECNTDENGHLQVKKVLRQSNKQFTLHTELLKEVVNIEAGMLEKISKRDFDELFSDVFDFEYDPKVTYIRLADLNNRLKKYLLSFDTLVLEEDVIFNAELKTRHRLLSRFKEELVKSLNENEHYIEMVLKKYQGFLPLIIPGLDGVAEFQYVIDNDEFPVNRIDIKFDNQVDFPNIIELKRADTLLFKKNEYRNNTCKLTSEFSNAIQQTNIQRNMMSAKEVKPSKVLVKSFLLIGNIEKEVEMHNISSDIVRLNLNIVRYNNKDCDIITYDQLINRLQMLLDKN